MWKFAVNALLLLSLCACAGTAVITADEGSSTLTKVTADGLTQKLSLPANPHNVQISADGKWILATGMPAAAHHHGGPMQGGVLMLIDAAHFDAPHVQSLPLGGHPAHVVTDGSGKIAYVTDSANNAVILVDIARQATVGKIAVGAFPHGARINPIKSELYTANIKDGTVSVVDLTTKKETHRIPVGNTPIQVAVTPDGKTLYVSLAKDSAVAMVDLSRYKKTALIRVPSAPAQVYADPAGKYVISANQGTADNPGATISIIEAGTPKVIKQLSTGKMPHGVVIDNGGHYAYITNMGEDTVAMVDLSQMALNSRYKVGVLPNGITLLNGVH